MDGHRTLLSWIASIAVFSIIGYFVWNANYASIVPPGSVEAVTVDVSATTPEVAAPSVPEPSPAETLSQPPKVKVKSVKQLPDKKSKAVAVTPTTTEEEHSPVEEPPPTEAAAEEEPPSGAPANAQETENAPAITESKEEASEVASTGEAAGETPAEAQSEPGTTEQTTPQFGTPGTMLNETQLSVMPGNKPPSYPWMARLKKQEGTVILRAYIRDDGTVDKVSIHQSSGSQLLDKEAAEKYFAWKYNPGKSGWVLKPFKFSLR